MANSISNRKERLDYIQKLQHEKVEKRRELMENAKKEIQAVKEDYRVKSQELESDTSAAISHINLDLHNEEKARKQQVAQAQETYNRKALKENQQRQSQLEEEESLRSAENAKHKKASIYENEL